MTAAARRSFEHAVQLFDSLDAAGTLDVAAAASDVESILALVASDANDQAREAHRARADAVSERLAHEHPRDARALGARIGYWSMVGNAQEQAKDYPGALQSFISVARAAEVTFDLAPDDLGGSRNLAIVYRKVGTEHELLGHLDDAEGFYRKAMAVDERRHAVGTSLSTSRLDLSFSQAALASVLLRKGRMSDALEQYRRAVELRHAAVDADPNDEFAKGALARGYDRVGVVLGRMGDVDGSLTAQADRVAVLEKWRLAHSDQAKAWSDETVAAQDGAIKGLVLLEAEGRPTVAQVTRVRAILARTVTLHEQWARDGRAGPLPPSKAEIDDASSRLRKLLAPFTRNERPPKD